MWRVNKGNYTLRKIKEFRAKEEVYNAIIDKFEWYEL